MPTPPQLRPAKIQSRPRFLVSIRSPAEANIAITGGADLIDIKEPRHGSLGFAGQQTIDEIAQELAESPVPPPLSVALGELRDWAPEMAVPRLPANITYAKLGLANCGGQHDWIKHWTQLRRRFDESAERQLAWIAVHYVDSGAAAPSFSQVFAAAQQTGCRGLLLDTFKKSNGALFDHISGETLSDCRRQTADAGLLFAVAGGLQMADLPRLVALGPDVVAVRSLACANGARQESIDRQAIEAINSSLDRATMGQSIGAK